MVINSIQVKHFGDKLSRLNCDSAEPTTCFELTAHHYHHHLMRTLDLAPSCTVLLLDLIIINIIIFISDNKAP